MNNRSSLLLCVKPNQEMSMIIQLVYCDVVSVFAFLTIIEFLESLFDMQYLLTCYADVLVHLITLFAMTLGCRDKIGITDSNFSYRL